MSHMCFYEYYQGSLVTESDLAEEQKRALISIYNKMRGLRLSPESQLLHALIEINRRLEKINREGAQHDGYKYCIDFSRAKLLNTLQLFGKYFRLVGSD